MSNRLHTRDKKEKKRKRNGICKEGRQKTRYGILDSLTVGFHRCQTLTPREQDLEIALGQIGAEHRVDLEHEIE